MVDNYVNMKNDTILALTNPTSAAYDPVFAGNLAWCFFNRAYGFADYNRVVAGGNMFPNNAGISNGPTQS